MAYPVLSAPYGLKPVNLVGGQVFSGSTKEYPIPYGYNTNIFNGDFVILAKGHVNRFGVTSSATNAIGVFLGCSFTNPVTKQKVFSNYWPAGTAASDAAAVVCDDPDTVFKAAVCSTGTTIGSVAEGLVGNNIQMLDNTGVVASGNSRNAIASATGSFGTSTTYPMNIVGVVPETAIQLGTYVTTTNPWSSTTLNLSTAITTAVPIGAEIQLMGADGQMTSTGAYTTVAYAAGTAAGASLSVSAPISSVPTGSTIAFVQYQEAYVKFNFGQHKYYNSLGVA